MNYAIILFFVLGILAISSIGIDNAFATIGAAKEYEPTQPNTLASYNHSTNQVQVSWDFNTLPADTICLLKGDFIWYDDLNDKHSSGVSGVDFDKANGFIPFYYSVVSSSPTVIRNTEVVPCEGSTRIDLNIIMNHSENINNYSDLEIFLTFYVPNADGKLNLSDQFRIDEVYVFYSPNNTLSPAAKNWGCDLQIGNTLYIDQTGIHGSNGDNCDGSDFKYLELQSNQWVDIGMKDSGSHGNTTYGYHNNQFQLLKLVTDPTVENKKNGGGNEWKTRPTFGIGHEVPTQLVTDGFTFDDKVYDITDNWHTDFNSTEIKTGEIHTFILKAYFPKIMKSMGFNLGIQEIGKGYDAELKIDAFFDYQGNMIHYELNQETNIVDPETLQILNFKATCDESDTQKRCDAVVFIMTFLEPLQHNIMAMQAVDQKNRSQWTYLNEGFNVTGNSLNEQPTYTLFNKQTSQQTDNLFLTLTRTDKIKNIWIDQNDIEYKQISSDRFDRITPQEPPQCNDKPLSELMNGGIRTNCNFQMQLPSLYQYYSK